MTQAGIIQGNTGEWEMVIGLEVHAQIASNTKLFSSSPTDFGAEPNHHVSLVDAALPGMLPVINRVCVEQAVRTGLGLEAEIHQRSVFDRKNYFYPDLPQGYQISQYLDPIVGKGRLVIELDDGSTREIGITRLHLEQDAGKSLHDHSPTDSFIDLNRSGIALMEIVSEPDIRTPEEAGAYVKKLRAIVRYLGTCGGDMEKGEMRCDANVSVRRRGATELGTRCEIKNVNSMRYVMKAIQYEAERQVALLESGQMVDQETRLYDANLNETRTMRSKEDAHDYRYFPDPDLLPLVISDELLAQIKSSLPELPDAKKQRYMRDYGLSAYDASVIVSDKEWAFYYEQLITLCDPRLAANWLTGELFGRLNKLGLSLTQSPIPASSFAGLIALIADNTISGKIAKEVLDKMMESGKEAAVIVDEEGLKQVTDTGAIERMLDEIIAANPDKVAEYRAGKDKLFAFFVGQAMKASGGKANPQMVNDLLKTKLAE
ncbi:MAG: Asp-tRNA(Asn)/Glu-tRNA(Gln) amidotransferase GatCAB subunit B [Alphaproteobacteria bacterium]|nr:MAG: Asp-tRNA(Asn)/Glu-tRNA(Gln) amidotransferase GatCAB subunit B [Alphaproteobacteria bacterium]